MIPFFISLGTCSHRLPIFFYLLQPFCAAVLFIDGLSSFKQANQIKSNLTSLILPWFLQRSMKACIVPPAALPAVFLRLKLPLKLLKKRNSDG